LGGGGVGVGTTVGCSCAAATEGADCGSSPREHPVTSGVVDIMTAAASIKGKDLPWGLPSSFIVD
jgi:hypothetical protein